MLEIFSMGKQSLTNSPCKPWWKGSVRHHLAQRATGLHLCSNSWHHYELFRDEKRLGEARGNFRGRFRAPGESTWMPNLSAVRSDVQLWKSWCLEVIDKANHTEARAVSAREEFCIRTKWPFHHLPHHCLAQFLLVIHYAEAVYHFVQDKGNFHQSVIELGIPGSLSKETESLIWIFTFLAPVRSTWSLTAHLAMPLTVMLCQSDITWETFRLCFATK